MATFERRGQYWRVKVRRAGLPPQTRTFDNKTQAQLWARSVESEIDKGIVVDRRVAERLSLAEVLERYRREVTPTKRGAADESIRLKAMAKRPFARIRMAALTSSHLAAYRDARLKVVSGATVNREFNVVSHAIETARREWDVYLPVNPCKLVRRPPQGPTPQSAPAGRRGATIASRLPQGAKHLARAFRGARHRDRHAAQRAPRANVVQRESRPAHCVPAGHQER